MLAYVFWHRPFAHVDRGRYEASILRFQAALARQKPPGFMAAVSFRIEAVPWLAHQAGCEDWCLLEGSWAKHPELGGRISDLESVCSATACSANANTATILTTFRAKTFADGASSLQTLRNLVERGFNLRHLDGLHAKLIITSEACLIGSQNISLAGTLNKEATAIMADTATATAAREGLASWRELSWPITLEMIDEMEIGSFPTQT
jgi:hypothetical protein